MVQFNIVKLCVVSFKFLFVQNHREALNLLAQQCQHRPFAMTGPQRRRRRQVGISSAMASQIWETLATWAPSCNAFWHCQVLLHWCSMNIALPSASSLASCRHCMSPPQRHRPNLLCHQRCPVGDPCWDRGVYLSTTSKTQLKSCRKLPNDSHMASGNPSTCCASPTSNALLGVSAMHPPLHPTSCPPFTLRSTLQRSTPHCRTCFKKLHSGTRKWKVIVRHATKQYSCSNDTNTHRRPNS